MERHQTLAQVLKSQKTYREKHFSENFLYKKHGGFKQFFKQKNLLENNPNTFIFASLDDVSAKRFDN